MDYAPNWHFYYYVIFFVKLYFSKTTLCTRPIYLSTVPLFL